MRVASSLAANPPNTTEWTAPMRAQASMAVERLQDHRHVDDDPVALYRRRGSREDGGERLDLRAASSANR